MRSQYRIEFLPIIFMILYFGVFRLLNRFQIEVYILFKEFSSKCCNDSNEYIGET